MAGRKLRKSLLQRRLCLGFSLWEIRRMSLSPAASTNFEAFPYADFDPKNGNVR